MNKVIFIAAVVIVAFSVGVIVAYFTVFTGGLSNNHTRWAEFGSFLGGTIGLLISVLSIFAFVYFTNLISRKDSQKHLTDLRSPNYKDLIFRLNMFPQKFNYDSHVYDELKIYLETYHFPNLLFLNNTQIFELGLIKESLFEALDDVTKSGLIVFKSDIPQNEKDSRFMQLHGRATFYIDTLATYLRSVMIDYQSLNPPKNPFTF